MSMSSGEALLCCALLVELEPANQTPSVDKVRPRDAISYRELNQPSDVIAGKRRPRPKAGKTQDSRFDVWTSAGYADVYYPKAYSSSRLTLAETHTMASLFPKSLLLVGSASGQEPRAGQGQKHRDLATHKLPFPAWSVAEDVKKQTDTAQRAKVAAPERRGGPAGKIELYSGKYYASCIMGGMLACGLTHAAVTPMDLAKCRLQVDPKMYKGILDAWSKIGRAEGIRGIYTGWGPTFFGYSAQGAFKYGGYEFFKKFYSDLLGEDVANRWRTPVYLAASATAELIADVALCPFEAVKVRMQTTIPPFASGTFSAISHVTAKEGVAGLYKGLYPLWGRQIPYTMMKFASFEKIVEMIYTALPGQKSDYNKGAQTAVAFTGGYLAGILCAIVSHPADVMVSKLNAARMPGEAFGAAMSRIYKQIGFSGLWNGLPVRIVMVGTLTGLQWMIYDAFKIFMGLPTTGGPAPAKKD